MGSHSLPVPTGSMGFSPFFAPVVWAALFMYFYLYLYLFIQRMTQTNWYIVTSVHSLDLKPADIHNPLHTKKNTQHLTPQISVIHITPAKKQSPITPQITIPLSKQTTPTNIKNKKKMSWPQTSPTHSIESKIAPPSPELLNTNCQNI